MWKPPFVLLSITATQKKSLNYISRYLWRISEGWMVFKLLRSRRSGSWNMPTTNYAMDLLMLYPLLLSNSISLMDRGPCLLLPMPWPCWDSAHSSSLPPSTWWIMEVWIVVHAYYYLCHGPAETPPTPSLYLHLPDGSWRSGSWSMPTTNCSYTVSYSFMLIYDLLDLILGQMRRRWMFPFYRLSIKVSCL